MIDTIDKQILNILQEDARISNADLARRVGMAPSGILERVKKVQEALKYAREQANSIEAQSQKVGEPIFSYLFGKE